MKMRIRISRWVPKTTIKPSEHLILIAFPPQQWMYERASMFRLYLQCPSCII